MPFMVYIIPDENDPLKFWLSDQNNRVCLLSTNAGGKVFKVEDPMGKCFENWKNFKMEDNIITFGPDGQQWKRYSMKEVAEILG